MRKSSKATPASSDDPLAGPAPKRGRCRAKTVAGKRCKRTAMEGALVCAGHIRKRGPGRPTKLDEDATERIVKILEIGGYVAVAAAAAGVGLRTFHDWMERGDPEGKAKADQPFRDFRVRIEEARSRGEQTNVMLIARAGERDWKAAAWLLERQFPDRWAGPRGRGIDSSLHPDDFAAGESSGQLTVVDDQVAADGRPL